MDAPSILRYARRRAGLTQRELAERTGVAQPTISRIEAGTVSPRVETLRRLLHECRFDLMVVPRSGRGIDRTAMRRLLARSPRERAAAAVAAARAVEEARR